MKAVLAVVVAVLVVSRVAYAGPDPLAVEKAQHEHRVGVGEEIAGIPLTILGGLGVGLAGYEAYRGVTIPDNYAKVAAIVIGVPAALVGVSGVLLWIGGHRHLREARALRAQWAITPTFTPNGGVGLGLAGTF